jgi:hypothetical protein
MTRSLKRIGATMLVFAATAMPTKPRRRITG